MSFKPEDYVGHEDEHFSEQDAKSFFDELEKGDLATLESKFQSFVSNAESRMEKFFTDVLGSASTLSDEAKKQIEEARASMKDEFSIKGAYFKKFITEKTKSVRNLSPASAKKPEINAEEIITKAQNAANLVVPKLKDLFAMSKAAAEGAVKGVKEMQKKKDDEVKKQNKMIRYLEI